MPVYTQCFTTNSSVYVSQYYGHIQSDGRPHGGVDIVISPDINIYAPQAGTVVTAELHYSWGNYVVVDMGNNNYYLIAHMQATEKRVGEVLAQGAYVGKQGTTGSSTGNHIHFEYWRGGYGTDYRTDPSPITGIPNAVGTYSVEWGAPEPPTPPGPDPPTPTPTRRKSMPVWMMLRHIP